MRALAAVSLGLLLLLVVAATGCRRAAGQSTEPARPVVRVSHPIEQEITDYQHFTGRMDAVESVEVRARVTGYLTKIHFKPGQEIELTTDEVPEEERPPLFTIDPRPYEAELERMQGQVLLSEAQLKLATANFARSNELAKTPGVISLQEIDQYAAALSEAEAKLKAARAALAAVDLNVKYTIVHTPITSIDTKAAGPAMGILGRPLITVGNLVRQDDTLLTTVVTTDPMFAYFDVDELTMLRVQALIREGKVASARDGAEVPVDLGVANEGDEYPHHGTIDFINNVVNPSTGTIQIRGVFKNPKSAKGSARIFTPGLFVRVRLQIGLPHPGLVVPQAAIGTDQGQRYLFVVNDKNIAEYRPVTVGAALPGGMQVVEPLKIVQTEAGFRMAESGESAIDSIAKTDRVVVNGLQRIRAGSEVDPRDAKDAPEE